MTVQPPYRAGVVPDAAAPGLVSTTTFASVLLAAMNEVGDSTRNSAGVIALTGPDMPRLLQ
jgi:hypothetical protein